MAPPKRTPGRQTWQGEVEQIKCSTKKLVSIPIEDPLCEAFRVRFGLTDMRWRPNFVFNTSNTEHIVFVCFWSKGVSYLNELCDRLKRQTMMALLCSWLKAC